MSQFESEEPFEIFFKDLVPDAQKRIMEFYGINDPSDMNWDVFAITEVYPFIEDIEP